MDIIDIDDISENGICRRRRGCTRNRGEIWDHQPGLMRSSSVPGLREQEVRLRHRFIFRCADLGSQDEALNTVGPGTDSPSADVLSAVFMRAQAPWQEVQLYII